MTSPAWLKEGNWWEWIGIEQVEGIFIDGRFIDIGVLMAMWGFWSTIDMEERGILWRICSEKPYPGGLVRDGESRE